MLKLFSKQIAELPLNRCFPFKANELAFMPGPKTNFFFVLKEIRDPDGYLLSIKKYMEDSPVFSCPNFDAKMDEFAKIMDTRLERFFETKKTDYIFFDKEEQQKLKGTLVNKRLDCVVDIYVRKNGEIRQLNFDRLGILGYGEIRKQVNELGIIVCVRPDKYIRMINQIISKAKGFGNRFKDYANSRKRKEDTALDEIFAKYPELNVQDKTQFTKVYRSLAIKFHPDKNPDNPNAEALFSEMVENIEKLKKTSWYKKLKDGGEM